MDTSEQITAKAKSNLAFVFMGLNPQQKKDMTVFYAFCRVVDDIADEIGPAPEEKHQGLDRWVSLISSPETFTPSSPLEKDMIKLLQNPEVDREACLGLIAGCRSDITPRFYESLDELKGYTFQVASCVGLVIVTLFGASKAAKNYVVTLGHALQLTNILRDVGEDWQKEERIYLPQELMARFGYSIEDLQENRHNEAFLALMTHMADEADRLYAQMATEYALLSSEDKKALCRTEAMRNIYAALLQQMRKDHFQVFTRRYKLGKLAKVYQLAKAWMASLWV